MQSQNNPTDQPWQVVARSLALKQDNLLAELKAAPLVNAIISRLRASFERCIPAQHLSATGEPLSTQEQQSYKIQRTNTLAALQECARLTGEIIEHRKGLKELLAEVRKPQNANERNHYIAAIKASREHIKELRGGYSAIGQSNPEAFHVVHWREFRRYARQLNSGAITRLPFVEGKVQEAANIIRITQGAIVYGPTGSGKTKADRIISQEVSGKAPLMISGHRDVGAREFRGHDKLKSSASIKLLEIPDYIEAKLDLDKMELEYFGVFLKTSGSSGDTFRETWGERGDEIDSIEELPNIIENIKARILTSLHLSGR